MDGADAEPSDDGQPRLLPGHSATCFGCGSKNASGLGVQVWRIGDALRADIAFDERHTGAPGLAHGGAIAAACDEVLSFVGWLIGALAVTRSLTVDYLAPVALRDTHTMTVRVDTEEDRKVLVVATAVNSAGMTAFTARAVFVKVPFEHFDGFSQSTKFLTSSEASWPAKAAASCSRALRSMVGVSAATAGTSLASSRVSFGLHGKRLCHTAQRFAILDQKMSSPNPMLFDWGTVRVLCDGMKFGGAHVSSGVILLCGMLLEMAEVGVAERCRAMSAVRRVVAELSTRVFAAYR